LILKFISTTVSSVCFLIKLGVVRRITFTFSSLGCMYVLYFTFILSLNTHLLFGIISLQMETNWNSSDRSSSPQVRKRDAVALRAVTIAHQYVTKGITSTHCILFKFNLVLNSGLLFWKLLAFEFLFDIIETFLWSVPALSVENGRLLDASDTTVVCRDIDVFGTAALCRNHTLQFLLLMR
jgi:hypothetical protein